ncbi:MAG: phytoene desaturase family protein [Cytophagaceae bacterium]|jgi:phytoene desaturase|nr:phytoene desaturase family protein [Cytophagaceae bacterium]
MAAKKVIIIGAGLGGLSTALRLASKGYQVEIIEKYHQAGGRLNEIKKDGFTFDMGPSFFSMSYEFKELFDACGVQNPLHFNELDPLYTVHFAHRDKPYVMYKNLARMAEEFKAIEPNMEAKVRRYLLSAKSIFHDTEYKIVKRNFDSILQYLLTLTTVPLKHAPKLVRSMWTELDKHFESEDVKVIFSLVAFFLGSTPFDTPAVYSLLNYTEIEHDGYWNVKGGMYRITEAMLTLLKEKNVTLHYNTEIVSYKMEGGKIKGFIDQKGQLWNADIYVCNSDAAGFRGEVLKRPEFREEKLDQLHWTLSPFTIYLGVDGKIPDLHHHNYFLGSNFKDYADTIFKTSVSPEKPYYYVNASSKSNPDCAPPNCENLFILCPVPDMRYKQDWSDAETLADTIIDDLGKRVGYDIKNNILSKTILHPGDWKDKFNLYKGSGLGLAHGMKQIGAFRPKNKDEEFSNLYYVGASTIPGTGLPIVVISSRLVTERIEQDHGNTF